MEALRQSSRQGAVPSGNESTYGNLNLAAVSSTSGAQAPLSPPVTADERGVKKALYPSRVVLTSQ